MTVSARAELFVTQMRRGRLPARSCRHVRVDGPDRPSGRNASPSRITPPTIMSPTRSRCGPWTEIRLSARAYTITTTNRAHAPPRGPFVHHVEIPRPRGLRQGHCTDKERGTAPTENCPPGVRFIGSF